MHIPNGVQHGALFLVCAPAFVLSSDLDKKRHLHDLRQRNIPNRNTQSSLRRDPLFPNYDTRLSPTIANGTTDSCHTNCRPIGRNRLTWRDKQSMDRGNVINGRPEFNIPDHNHLCSTKQLPSSGKSNIIYEPKPHFRFSFDTHCRQIHRLPRKETSNRRSWIQAAQARQASSAHLQNLRSSFRKAGTSATSRTFAHEGEALRVPNVYATLRPEGPYAPAQA
jgi:hypothetical protein